MLIKNQEEPVKGKELPQWLVFTFLALMASAALLISTGNISWLPEKVQAAIKNNFGGSPSKGVAGPQGPQGDPGPAGPMGPQGSSGEDGTPGEVGPKGETGAAGETGTNGSTGPTGPIGLTGATGLQGENGEPGETGATGPQGEQGLQGPRGATGLQGVQGIQGIQGPPGGFGAYGSFYDTASHALFSGTATTIPLSTTQFSNGISIVDGYKITFANSGKYNLAFSSQLYNSANQRRIVSIWLSKNGTTSEKWVADSSTDVYIGTSLDSERLVAAWNFFVDATPGDFYVLMIAADGANVSIHDGSSGVTTPIGIPDIPSTILTVSQVG